MELNANADGICKCRIEEKADPAPGFALRTESIARRSLFKPDIPALRTSASCAIFFAPVPSSAVHRDLFGSDIDTAGSTHQLLDVTVDG